MFGRWMGDRSATAHTYLPYLFLGVCWGTYSRYRICSAVGWGGRSATAHTYLPYLLLGVCWGTYSKYMACSAVGWGADPRRHAPTYHTYFLGYVGAHARNMWHVRPLDGTPIHDGTYLPTIPTSWGILGDMRADRPTGLWHYTRPRTCHAAQLGRNGDGFHLPTYKFNHTDHADRCRCYDCLQGMSSISRRSSTA